MQKRLRLDRGKNRWYLRPQSSDLRAKIRKKIKAKRHTKQNKNQQIIRKKTKTSPLLNRKNDVIT